MFMPGKYRLLYHPPPKSGHLVVVEELYTKSHFYYTTHCHITFVFLQVVVVSTMRYLFVSGSYITSLLSAGQRPVRISLAGRLTGEWILLARVPRER